jgi:uncharacterized membrane protein YdjX (TVP38/TMEM64 family)
MRRAMRDRRIQVSLFAIFFLGLCACAAAWRAGIGLGEVMRWWDLAVDFLRERPLWLLLALVVLPGLPVPTSALLFVAGVVWRENPVAACAIHLVTMGMNLSWTYWLAAGFGRRTVERFLGMIGITMPEVQGESRLRLVLVLKLTPGIPLFVQNYLCGVLRVPFRLYLLVSLLCNGIIGIGFVLAGVGFGEGKLVPALTGLSLVALGILATQWIRGFLANKRAGGGR